MLPPRREPSSNRRARSQARDGSRWFVTIPSVVLGYSLPIRTTDLTQLITLDRSHRITGQRWSRRARRYIKGAAISEGPRAYVAGMMCYLLELAGGSEKPVKLKRSVRRRSSELHLARILRPRGELDCRPTRRT